jgi:hypothetical protein
MQVPGPRGPAPTTLTARALAHANFTLSDGLVEEGARTLQIAPLPEEDVDHLPVLVHRPIEVRPPAGL